jgi:hypothetical protein
MTAPAAVDDMLSDTRRIVRVAEVLEAGRQQSQGIERARDALTLAIDKLKSELH